MMTKMKNKKGNMIMNFNSNTCKVLREQMNKALEAVAKQNGIKLTVGNMSYSSSSIKISVEAIALGSNGENLKDKDSFEIASLYGLEPSDYGKKFKSNGKEFTLIRIDSKKRNYPIIAKANDGKEYKFPADRVKALLKAKV